MTPEFLHQNKDMESYHGSTVSWNKMSIGVTLLTVLDSCPSHTTFSMSEANGVDFLSSLRPLIISFMLVLRHCSPSEIHRERN